MLAVIADNWEIIATALLALSEVLALLPGVKANSVFQLIVKGIKALVGDKPEAK